MRDKVKKIIKKNKFLLTNFVAAVILLGLSIWHFSDVRAGAIESGDVWLMKQYLILTTISLGGVIGIGWMLYRRKKLEQVYLLTGLFFGLLYMFILPPLSAPDEVSHYISAYQLSSRMMGKPSNYKTGHVLIRTEDWFIEDVYENYQYKNDEGFLVFTDDGEGQKSVLGQMLSEETYRIIHETGKRHVDRGTAEAAVSTYPPVRTTSAAYFPQALGISLARLLNVNSLGLLYMGRLFNLLFVIAVIYLAMLRMPFGKEVLFGVMLLPMSLHLTASFSYDVMIMGGLFYFMACCLDLAYRKEHVHVKDVIVLACWMAVIGPCKIVYAVFMGLCLLIPVKKFGSWRRWGISAFVVAGAMLVSMLLVNSQTIASYVTETDTYVAWAAEPGYSLTMIIHQPLVLLKMLYSTIIWQLEYYHMTMIGAYLGNVDMVLDVPYVIVLLLTGCLLLLAFKKPGETILLTGKNRIWVWFLCLSCIGGLMVSMLIAWTPVSSPVINGVQGRYFLPFLPILLMTCKNHLLVLTENINYRALYIMCFANLYVLLRLFSIVCIRI